MIIKDDEYGEFSVCLCDDGTLDTVISVSHVSDEPGFSKSTKQEIRFDTEYGANFRDDDGAMTDAGFEELAKEAVEAYIEQYLLV